MPKKKSGFLGGLFNFNCSVRNNKVTSKKKKSMNEIEFELAVDRAARDKYGDRFTEEQHAELWKEMQGCVELRR